MRHCPIYHYISLNRWQDCNTGYLPSMTITTYFITALDWRIICDHQNIPLDSHFHQLIRNLCCHFPGNGFVWQLCISFLFIELQPRLPEQDKPVQYHFHCGSYIQQVSSMASKMRRKSYVRYCVLRIDNHPVVSWPNVVQLKAIEPNVSDQKYNTIFYCSCRDTLSILLMLHMYRNSNPIPWNGSTRTFNRFAFLYRCRNISWPICIQNAINTISCHRSLYCITDLLTGPDLMIGIPKTGRSLTRSVKIGFQFVDRMYPC